MSSRADIGAGPGLPVIGDEVEVYPGSFVLGPIHIGDRVSIGPGCGVLKDVPAGSVLQRAEARAYKISRKDGAENAS